MQDLLETGGDSYEGGTRLLATGKKLKFLSKSYFSECETGGMTESRKDMVY